VEDAVEGRALAVGVEDDVEATQVAGARPVRSSEAAT
jgi:hypothetical protein